MIHRNVTLPKIDNILCLQVLSKWIDNFKIESDDLSQTMVVRFLLRPMIGWLVQHDQSEIFTQDLVKKLIQKVFGKVSAEESDCHDLLQSEMIQVCVLLVQHAPHLLRDYKKELIQYIW